MGYSCGVYGCSNEYFTAIIVNTEERDPMSGVPFKGLYGAEYRIAEVLKAKGYEQYYTASGDFGRMSAREVSSRFWNETEAIEYINKNIK